MTDIIRAATVSAGRFLGMAWRGSLHLRHDRLGNRYLVSRYGPYVIFRETVSTRDSAEDSVTLIVGFRLKLLRSSRISHWIFQRVCVLTTPFWSGLTGFKVKLWMVDPKTKSYLGIYDWRGREYAERYASLLERVLRPLSVKESVCHHITSDKLEDYLQEHAAEPIISEGVALARSN